MTALVPIIESQWALAYIDHFWPGHIDGDMAGALERLSTGGSGWDCLRRADEQFNVIKVDRVMPKTFMSRKGNRHHRELVVAACISAGEAFALRDRLFNIGFTADRAIEEETGRLIADFACQTRADALAKIHAALPHIFEIVTEAEGIGGRPIVHP